MNRSSRQRLAGKTALITGASSGIGRAIARKFHDEGATLLLMDITDRVLEGGEPTHRILKVPFFQGDVSREADVEEAVRRAADPTGRLDIVVNDAVVRSGKMLTETSLEEWNRVMAVNVTGALVIGILGGFGESAPGKLLMSEPARTFIMIGVLGGYTTFSSFSAEVVSMLLQARYGLAFATAGLHLLGSLALTVLGLKTVALFLRQMPAA